MGILPHIVMSEDSCSCTDYWQKVSHILCPSCLFVQHEKYTSGLQLSIKALEAKAKEKQQLQSSDKSKASGPNVKLQDRAERRAHSVTGKQLYPHTLHHGRYQQEGSSFNDNGSRSIVLVAWGELSQLKWIWIHEGEEVFLTPCAAQLWL